MILGFAVTFSGDMTDVCPHIRALTWLLLIYYATWISLSEFHMISQDQATYFLIILHLHILYSRFNTYFSLHMPLPVWIQGSACVYPFHFPCLRLPISHNVHILLQLSSVSVMHACVYPFIHSGVVVSLELPKPLSSHLTHWLRRFLILHLQVLYSMDTHTSISICGLPLWIQGNACVYPFLFLCVFLYIYLNMHIHLQLPEMSVVSEYVYPLVCSLWCDGLSGYPQRV